MEQESGKLDGVERRATVQVAAAEALLRSCNSGREFDAWVDSPMRVPPFDARLPGERAGAPGPIHGAG